MKDQNLKTMNLNAEKIPTDNSKEARKQRKQFIRDFYYLWETWHKRKNPILRDCHRKRPTKSGNPP